jgi:hypothetical protein
MKSSPPPVQESQAGNSTPPANAAVYRRVRTATGCAFLATAVITSICVAVAALPLLPVLLAGLTLGAALAAACIWSAVRLNDLEEEQIDQNLPKAPEIPKKEGSQSEINAPSADPNAGPNGAQQTTGPENDPNKDPSSPLGDPEDLPEPHQTSPGDMPEHPVDAPEPPGEDPQAPPITQEDGPVVGPPDQPDPHENIPEPPKEIQDPPPPIEPEADPVDTIFAYQVDSASAFSGTLTGKVSIPKKAQPVDINSLSIAAELSRAKSLHFHGMDDGKFLFVCSPETGGSQDGTYFYADNIEDVWAKLESVTHFRFLCNPGDDFKISGDNIPNLERITFFSDDIEEIEIAKHLTGSFENLERITFRKCNSMHTAKVNGNWKAGKLENITFENCPVAEDIHVGSDLNSYQYTNNQVHTHPKGCTFGDRASLYVQLFECQKLFEKAKSFSSIKIDNSTISGTTSCHGKRDDGPCILCSNVGTFESGKISIQKANNTSTIGLQMPDVGTDCVDLREAKIESHAVIDFDLARCTKVQLPEDAKIAHLEFTKPIANCRVEFDAHGDGTLLEIKNVAASFGITFVTNEPSKLPRIKLNDTNLENINWYRSNTKDGYLFLHPVILENLKKANNQVGWAPLEEEAVWERYARVELNSDFLFAAAAG